jgi:hypothetical protein
MQEYCDYCGEPLENEDERKLGYHKNCSSDIETYI